ncbi:MAG: FliM/FliN family flagellar motor switch protein [Aeromonadaceae bacterium]
MSESYKCSGKVLSAAEAAAIPTYDLLGQGREAADALRTLNQLRRGVSQAVTGCFSHLFNGYGCQLEYGPFAAGLPQIAGGEEWLWVCADSNQGVQALLCMPPRVLYRLAILFFGGALYERDGAQPLRPLSETELRLLLRLTQHQLDILSELTGEGTTEWRLNLVAAETLPAEGSWVSSEVTLLLGEHDAQWHLCWPVTPKERLALPNPGESLGQRLHQALPQVPVRMRILLSEFTLRLGELQGLAEGDILPLELNEQLPALIGSQPCFTGRMAEHNRGLVYQIDAINQA